LAAPITIWSIREFISTFKLIQFKISIFPINPCFNLKTTLLTFGEMVV